MISVEAVDDAAVLEHADVKGLTRDEWRQRLRDSVHRPVQDGRRYPGFPDAEVQKAFVGSAYGDALDEGFRFYSYVQDHLLNRRFRVPSTRYLDFGCGWGRISRFFLRDFERGDMVGVDVDPGMTAFCNTAHLPGGHFTIASQGLLPFADASFRLSTAYSVFTHLPEGLFRHWLAELLRVTAPGGLIAFTVEPERYLDFIAAIDPETTPSAWYAVAHEKLGDVERRRRELREKGLTYLPTGGGAYRPEERYGETVVTQAFIEACVGVEGDVIAFLDQPNLFWQAVVLVRKNRWTVPFRGRKPGRNA